MNVKAARWAVSVIAVMTMAMLGYVILRTELLELSYDIQKQNKSLKESREELRVLQFDVSQKKALANLDTLSVRLASPLAQPARVNHLFVESAKPPLLEPKHMVFPQNFFSLFSMVPDAFAKTEDKKS